MAVLVSEKRCKQNTGTILFKLLITLGLIDWAVGYYTLTGCSDPSITGPILFRLKSLNAKPFARAQYAYGLHAWFQNDPETAAEFFRQAVSQDIFFMDAWLKLAEAEATMGIRKNRVIF